MNEDLLKHRFDDELKAIAVKFSSLLKSIVGTIDKYGLKARHLNKHRAHAERFCNWVIGQAFRSGIAKNYVRRIAKYRMHLFAFLVHDGIPWNNNNAEQAIKSFAKFRRSSNGVVTEDSVDDYVVILSVCLTCQYRGIDFLKVLLGKERRDFGFGPKRTTPLRLRPPPERLALQGRKTVTAPTSRSDTVPIDTASHDETYVKPKGLYLNNLLPKMFDGLCRSFPNFRYRAELATDLWSVQLDSKELEIVIMAIIYLFRRGARRRTVIVSARNLRFDKTHPAIGLKGRYVAVSLSDGGRIEQLRRPAREDEIPSRFGIGFTLDAVCAAAKGFGGTTTVKSVGTGRKVVTTIVTTYIPQYLARPTAGTKVAAAAAQ